MYFFSFFFFLLDLIIIDTPNQWCIRYVSYQQSPGFKLEEPFDEDGL